VAEPALTGRRDAFFLSIRTAAARRSGPMMEAVVFHGIGDIRLDRVKDADRSVSS
jgi:hypothetical protein